MNLITAKPLHLDAAFAERHARSYTVINSAIEDVTADEGIVDHVISDPPYDKRTQSNTRRGRKTDKAISEAMPLGFEPMTSARRDRWAQWMATVTRGWAAVFSDHESSMDWAAALERWGMVYVRCGLWIRTGDAELGPEQPDHSGAPQFTGDRPAQQHEVIVFAHSRRRRMRWNGGGKGAIYTAPVVRGDLRAHPTQKPLRLLKEIVRDFCQPGELVADPFAGSGTTLVACKLAGIGCVGVELEKNYASYAARRAAAATQLSTAMEI